MGEMVAFSFKIISLRPLATCSSFDRLCLPSDMALSRRASVASWSWMVCSVSALTRSHQRGNGICWTLHSLEVVVLIIIHHSKTVFFAPIPLHGFTELALNSQLNIRKTLKLWCDLPRQVLPAKQLQLEPA